VDLPISGAHVIIYSTDSAADRKFFRDVLKFPYVDVGEGWLIFSLPPAEVAIHPTKSSKENETHSLFLMCDRLEVTLKSLKRKKVKYSMLDEQRWGKIAMIKLPSGAELGLYEPKQKAHVFRHGMNAIRATQIK
jgi:hypothetical protein